MWARMKNKLFRVFGVTVNDRVEERCVIKKMAHA